MKWKNLDGYQKLALLNLVIISFIYVDLYFPVENTIIEKFDSFDSSVISIRGKSGASSYGVNNYINCKNGKSYFITKTPSFQGEFSSGSDFILMKTFFLNKIKAIVVKNKGVMYFENIAFLNFTLNKIFYFIALIVSLINVFYSKNWLTFLLAFATVFTFMMTLCYLF